MHQSHDNLTQGLSCPGRPWNIAQARLLSRRPQAHRAERIERLLACPILGNRGVPANTGCVHLLLFGSLDGRRWYRLHNPHGGGAVLAEVECGPCTLRSPGRVTPQAALGIRHHCTDQNTSSKRELIGSLYCALSRASCRHDRPMRNLERGLVFTPPSYVVYCK